MITFTCTDNDYTFVNNGMVVAYGGYDAEGFLLFHGEDSTICGSAVQAFCQLKAVYEPNRVVSPSTMELFTTPARAIDNMSKYMHNALLQDITEEVFHAKESK